MDAMLSVAVRTAVVPSIAAFAEPIPTGPASANTNAPANVTNNLRIISLQPWFEFYAFQTSATYQSAVLPKSFRMVGAKLMLALRQRIGRCDYGGDHCRQSQRVVIEVLCVYARVVAGKTRSPLWP
jgi:hypothetical protein